QTPVNLFDPKRVLLNEWIRDNDVFDGYIDGTKNIEVDTDNNILLNAGRVLTNGTAGWPTSDGVHLNGGITDYIAEQLADEVELLLLFGDFFELTPMENLASHVYYAKGSRKKDGSIARTGDNTDLVKDLKGGVDMEYEGEPAPTLTKGSPIYYNHDKG